MQESYIKRSVQAGADGYILKNSPTEELITAVKETDRIAAIQNELAKFGIVVDAEGDYAMVVHAGSMKPSTVPVHTYEDHRMAMAFAPLAMLFEGLAIEEPEVVEKSYPAFWTDLKNLDFEFSEA